MSEADYHDSSVVPFPQDSDPIDRAAQDVLITLQRAAHRAAKHAAGNRRFS